MVRPSSLGRRRHMRGEYASGLLKQVQIIERSMPYFPPEHFNGNAVINVRYKYQVLTPPPLQTVVPVVAMSANPEFGIKCWYYPYRMVGKKALGMLKVMLIREMHHNAAAILDKKQMQTNALVHKYAVTSESLRRNYDRLLHNFMSRNHRSADGKGGDDGADDDADVTLPPPPRLVAHLLLTTTKPDVDGDHIPAVGLILDLYDELGNVVMAQ